MEINSEECIGYIVLILAKNQGMESGRVVESYKN